MSRCFGDLADTECGISCEPFVTHRQLVCDEEGDSDLFLIMASDGVWEHIPDDEAVALVQNLHSQGSSAKAACTCLMATAAVRWREEEGEYRDDISAIVVYLPCIAANAAGGDGGGGGGACPSADAPTQAAQAAQAVALPARDRNVEAAVALPARPQNALLSRSRDVLPSADSI